MGPSGAGKTTFLNALMGTVKYGTISGQVWVNGRAMKMSRLRRIMGFVPQVRSAATAASAATSFAPVLFMSTAHSQCGLPVYCEHGHWVR